MNRQFQYRNEGFRCENCQQEVPKHQTSCRNHCPFCLTSKHVDRQPGDRSHTCQGLMDAIGYQIHSKKGLMLYFRCRKCNEITNNINAIDDSLAADDYDLILKLGVYSG